MKLILQRIFLSLGLLFSLLTFASRLGWLHWTLDVLSHYHIQYGVGLAICLLSLLALRALRWQLLPMLLALLLNLSLVVPYFLRLATPVAHASSTQPPLRVMALSLILSLFPKCAPILWPGCRLNWRRNTPICTPNLHA